MKTICLDFDGVMNTYDGWKGDDELFAPRPHLRDFLSTLKSEGYRVLVHSTRPPAKILAWLTQWEITEVDEVTAVKPPAICYVDDRAVLFDGSFEDTLKRIQGFHAHWEQGAAGLTIGERAAIAHVRQRLEDKGVFAESLTGKGCNALLRQLDRHGQQLDRYAPSSSTGTAA